MFRLIALDLDDTLLGQDSEISQAHLEAVAVARAMGCEVTLVTARSWAATRPYAEQLGLTAPVICMAGAVLYDISGRPLQTVELPASAARELATWTDAERWVGRFYYADGRIIQSNRADDYVPGPGGGGNYRFATFVEAMAPYVEGGEVPLQVAFIGDRSVEGALSRMAFLPGVAATAYRRGEANASAHLLHASVTKGSTLEAYCRRYGFARESVIAMGDGEADLPMIEWAGCGVAMGWAPEHVRAAADLVTDPGDPHPVATALRSLLPI